MDKKEEKFPYEIHDIVTPFSEDAMKSVSVGPEKFTMVAEYKKIAKEMYNFAVRPNDTFVVSYPRSGTTWTQELVWLVVKDLDYAGSAAEPLPKRYCFIENSTYYDEKTLETLMEINKHSKEKTEMLKDFTKHKKVDDIPSPRFIKTHLSMSLLPPKLIDTAKVVYVARDPRDVIVSNYMMWRSVVTVQYNGDFKQYWEYFKEYQSSFYYNGLKQAWNLRHHHNMLFLFYEELSKDLPATITRVADFFGKKYSKEEIQTLCQHLSFENFKNNTSVNGNEMKELGIWEGLIRKGKSGGWREHFDEDLAAEAELWIQENLRDTDLHFPSMTQGT